MPGSDQTWGPNFLRRHQGGSSEQRTQTPHPQHPAVAARSKKCGTHPNSNVLSSVSIALGGASSMALRGDPRACGVGWQSSVRWTAWFMAPAELDVARGDADEAWADGCRRGPHWFRWMSSVGAPACTHPVRGPSRTGLPGRVRLAPRIQASRHPRSQPTSGPVHVGAFRPLYN